MSDSLIFCNSMCTILEPSVLCLYHVLITNLHNNDLKTKTFVSVFLFVFFFYLKEVKSCHVHTVSVDISTGSFKYTQVLQKMFSFEGLKGFENLKQDVYNVVRL